MRTCLPFLAALGLLATPVAQSQESIGTIVDVLGVVTNTTTTPTLSMTIPIAQAQGIVLSDSGSGVQIVVPMNLVRGMFTNGSAFLPTVRNDKLTVLNTSTDTITKTIDLEFSPFGFDADGNLTGNRWPVGVAVTATGSHVFVLLSDAPFAGGTPSLLVVNTATDIIQILTLSNLTNIGFEGAITALADGSKVFVLGNCAGDTSAGNACIDVITANGSYSETSVIQLPSSSELLAHGAITTDGLRLVTTNGRANLYVVDLSGPTPTVHGPKQLFDVDAVGCNELDGLCAAAGIALHALYTNLVFLAFPGAIGSGTVLGVNLMGSTNPADWEVTSLIPFADFSGDSPHPESYYARYFGLAVYGSKVYVAGKKMGFLFAEAFDDEPLNIISCNCLYVIDLSSGNSIQTVQLPFAPMGVSEVYGTSKVYVYGNRTVESVQENLGMVVIKKEVPGADPDTDFGFTSTLPLTATFSLDDGGELLRLVEAGTYTVTEDNPLAQGFQLTDLACVETDGTHNSSVDKPNRTATIRLEAGETVTCTFTNTPVTPCDVDGNGSINITDIQSITAARNTPASGPNDPRDVDGDGTITVLDARQCVLRCTKPRCAL